MLTPEKMRDEFSKDLKKGKVPKGQTGFFQGMNIQNPEHLILEKGALRFEVMGGVNFKQLDRLKVTLSLSRYPILSSLHVIRHTLDLYNNGQVKSFIRNTAEQLELGTNDVRIPIYDFVNTIEAYRLDKRQQMLLPTRPKEVSLNPKAIKEAKQLLNDKNLLPKIAELLKTCGLVNEATNGLLLFNIFLTRFFDKPLHAVVHGTSGSGKTNLLTRKIHCK